MIGRPCAVQGRTRAGSNFRIRPADPPSLGLLAFMLQELAADGSAAAARLIA
jgi:hypothetical protein